MSFYFICGCQYDNLGDLVINKLLIDELSKYGIVYVDFLRAPNHFRKYILANDKVVDVYKQFGFSFVNISLSFFYKLFGLVKKQRICFLTHSPGPRNRGTLKTRVLNTILDIVLASCGAKHIYIGNCYSTAFYNDDKLVRTFFPYYYLRSLESVEYARKFISPNRVFYIPDMCFLLSNHPKQRHVHKSIAFDFRPLSMDWDCAINECKKLAAFLIKSGYKIILYFQVESDKVFVERLYQEIECTDVLFRRDIVWYDDMSFYKNVSAVVSNRLHSLLLGGAFGAYPICVTNDNEKTIKINHVFESAFSNALPLMFTYEQLMSTDIDKLIQNNLHSFICEYDYNTYLCKEIIKSLVQ